jgi:hypothetical protein
MATIEVTITGENFSNLVRTRLADLAAKAVLSGYPKLSVRIANSASALAKLAKTGDASALDNLAIEVAARCLWAAVNATPGATPPNDGDYISLTITPCEPSDKKTYPPTHDWPWERTPAKFGDKLPVTVNFPLRSEAHYLAAFA